MDDGLNVILPHVLPFLLVLFRLGGIFIFGPLFGSSLIPPRVKVLLALALAVCVYPLVPAQPIALSLPTMVLAVASEMLIGLAIGFGASLPLMAMQTGGVIMGQQLGFGMAQLYNPDFDEETDIIGQLFYLLALMAFLAINGHHAVLWTLVNSFHRIPLGGFVPGAGVVGLICALLLSMFDLALRVSAPLLCLVFLETVALGFLARTVPQLNIMTLGFAVRIIVGLMLMAAMVGLQFDAVCAALRDSLSLVMRFFGG